MGRMEIMDIELGDEQLDWDANDAESVKKAEKTFNQKLSEGFKAFTVKVVEKVERSKEIKKFDPSLGRVLLAAPMRGGPTHGQRTTALPAIRG